MSTCSYWENKNLLLIIFFGKFIKNISNILFDITFMTKYRELILKLSGKTQKSFEKDIYFLIVSFYQHEFVQIGLKSICKIFSAKSYIK